MAKKTDKKEEKTNTEKKKEFLNVGRNKVPR
jgi:hypothetical protein